MMGISKKFLENGYVIVTADNQEPLLKVKQIIFEKCKQYESAIILQKARLEDERKKNELFEERKGGSDYSSLGMIYPAYQCMEPSKKIDGDNFNVVNGPEESLICVGRNASENERIRSRWSGPNDWWFHISNRRSAHIFLKTGSRLKSPSIKQINFIASLFFNLEQTKHSKLEFVYTRVKYLRSISGQAGQVTYKNEQHITISKED